MQYGGPEFILAIVAISTIGWIITTAIRARHGYPVEGEWGGTVSKADPATKRIEAENEQLKITVERLEARLNVLERIATDPAQQLSSEIDQLR